MLFQVTATAARVPEAPNAVQVLKHLASTLWRCMQAVEASNTSGTFVGADHEDADDGAPF